MPELRHTICEQASRISGKKETTMQAITLSCRCGNVHLHVVAAPIAQFYCHCNDCRAVTGGAVVPIALFSSDAVTVSGAHTSTWTYKTLPRTRCSTCGTFLFGEPPGLGVRGVSGFLLPADMFEPAFHIQCQSAVLAVKDDLPHFKGLPASFGGTDETIGW
jgi:hypothetical protein